MLSDDERKKNKQRKTIFLFFQITGFLIALMGIIALGDARTKNSAGTITSGLLIIFLIIGGYLIAMDHRFTQLRIKEWFESDLERRMFYDPESLDIKELLNTITDLETILQSLESNYKHNLISEEKYIDSKNKYSERLEIYYKKLHELRRIK